jgi:hypothetical protein
VVGAELLRDGVGVAELVALHGLAGLAVGAVASREADTEGAQVLAGLGEERDDEAGVQAAEEQDADVDVGDRAAAHRGP